MNKYIFIIIILSLGYNQSKGQQKKYILGSDLWGSISIDNNDYTGTSLNKQTGFSVGGTLYGGKFVTSKLLVYISFKTYYKKDNYLSASPDYNNPAITNEYRTKGTYFEYQPGIGIRKYWAFSEKDIVGLFADLKISIGPNERKRENVDIRQGQVSTEYYYEKNYNALAELIPGAYINLNKNWQMLLSMGGLFYSHTWWKDHNTNNNRNYNNINIIYPEAAKSFGLNFNTQAFVLSLARRL